MNRSKGLSVQNRLILGLGAVVGVLVALVLVAYLGLAKNAESERALFENNFGNAYDLANLRSHLNAERLDVFAMAETAPEAWGPWQKDLDERRSASREILQRLENRFQNDPASLAKLRELIVAHEVLLRIRETEVLPGLRAGRLAEVNELLLGIQMKQHLKIRALALELEAGEAAEAEGMARDTARRTQALLRVFAITGTLAVLGALALGVFLHRAMASYVTERQRAEHELLRANRALRTISLCNQILVRASSEAALLRDICETVVREGGYLMAWIGFAENDPDQTVRPAAHAGAVADYLDQARITWADTAQGHGPTGNAIRTGHPSVCRDIRNDPDFAPWRERALKLGYASSSVLPLLAEGRVFGALSIYAAEVGAFDAAELKLLSELAEDLAYGIQVHRIRDERQQAVEALRRAGAYNRSLIEASLDPLVTIGPDGRIADVNAATETATGRSRGELIGTDFSDYFTEPEKARAGYRQVFRDGLVRDYPLKVRHRDGHLISVLYNASVYLDEAGNVVGVFAAARDVTGRERTVEALRRSEEELKNAQRIAHIGSWWMDNVTNEVVWTEELYRMLGLDPALPPPPYPEHHRLFTPESWQRLSTALPRTQETGAPYDLELEMVRPDGSRGWMQARGEPLRNAAGVIIGLRGSALDITERKRAEAALIESEREFRTLAEAMPQIVWATRADGWNIYFNQRWVDYTGMSLAESYGDGWNKPFHPDDQQRAWEAWQEATQHGATYSLEVRLRRKDGEYRWWLVRGVPLFDAAGKILKWFGTCTDIHDLKVAEDEIRRLNTDLERRVVERTRELQAANKELESFSYSVSHDLRAPLRSIDGFSRMLLEDIADKLDAEGRDNLRRVRSATQRMGELIDDLLKLSRVVRADMHRVTFDLSALVQATVADLQAAEPARPVACTVEPGLQATADPSLLRVVLENLLSNAWKFTGRQADARIEFGATERNGERAFFVRDNGAGFDPAYGHKLFGPFQRLHGQEEFPGHGIGLATVQRIIHRHGGRVWAEGQVDEGATFYFTLPGKIKTP